MPRVCVWLIRSALGYLGAGYTLGAALLVNKGTGAAPGLWRWLPVHVELLLMGWLVQLVMGVAYWIFPRFGMRPAARGRERLAWIAFALLNAGIVLVCWGVIGNRQTPAVLGRTAELAAIGAMALHVWARTRASGLSPM